MARLGPPIKDPKEQQKLEDQWNARVQADKEASEAAAKTRQLAAIKRADWRQKGAALSAAETVEDVVRSGVSRIGRAVAGAPGFAADIYKFGQLARAYQDSWLQGRPYEKVLQEQDQQRAEGKRGYVKPETVEKYGSEAFIKSAADIKKKSGSPLLPALTYEPKTRPGEIAGTVAEVGTGAVAGRAPLAMAQAATRMAPRYIGRGLAREAIIGTGAGAGQAAAEQLTDNPVVALSAGVLGGAAAGSRGSKSAERAVTKATGNATAQQVQAAEELFTRAQVRGIPITRAQALDAVTRGGTNASELQRVVESAGSPALQQHFAGAPEAVRREGGVELNRIAPVSQQPSTIGPRVSETAGEVIDRTRQDVNAQVRPQYQQFETQPVDPAQMQLLMQDPAFAATYQDVLTNPNLHHLRTNLPPDSVGMIDLVNQRLNRQRQDLTTGTSVTGADRQEAESLRRGLRVTEPIASEASRPPQAPGAPPPTGPTPLDVAQAERARLEQERIAPLEAGPEGRLNRAQTTEAAQGAVFPKAPVEGSHQEVGRAISALAAQDPNLAREFVRNYLGTKFAASTAANIPGEPYQGGAKFWKDVVGNPEQRESLLAALRALPNGNTLAEGFTRFGEILEAMGQRQHPGSKTAFNTPKLEELSQGGAVEQGAKIAGSGGLHLPGWIKEKFERWRLGQNTEEIADLLTNPARAEDWRVLARLPADSPAAQRVLQRIMTAQPNAALTAEVAAPVLNDPGISRWEEKR